jgi:hypothetical protein
MGGMITVMMMVMVTTMTTTMMTLHFITLSTVSSYICCLNKHVVIIPETTQYLI